MRLARTITAPLLVGALALVGSYLASRWQAAHSAKVQRVSLLHEQRIALYVDLLADCRHSRTWLDNLTEEYDTVQEQFRPASYRPEVPVDIRVDLLAPPRTKAAWAAMTDAFAALKWELEAQDYPQHERDFVSSDHRQWLAAGQALADVDAAIRADLAQA